MTNRLLPGAEYVRDVEAVLPPVAELPAPVFELTPPGLKPETARRLPFDVVPVGRYNLRPRARVHCPECERSNGPHYRGPCAH